MRVLMAIAQFQLGHGGAELQAHKLARALQARGHSVEILSTRAPGAPGDALVEGVRVRRLLSFGARRGLWRLDPYLFTASLGAELVRRRGAHDVVHVHQAFHPAFAAVLARRLGGAPVVVKVATAGEYGDLTQMRGGRPTLPKGSARMLGTILDGADAIVAISSAIADELAGAGVDGERLVRIPNGVELPSRPTPTERQAARRSLGLDEGDEVVIYVGRAGAQKGADLLVDAWPEVARRRPRARLLLLGEGLDADARLAPALAALDGRARALGRVRDVPRYLAAADLFALPSRGEGLSNAILEAMAHGLPCVVSDLPANRDLVGDGGEAAIVVPVGDRAALASAIADSLAHPESLAPRAEAARRRVEERFTLAAVAERYERLYERLAAGGGAA